MSAPQRDDVVDGSMTYVGFTGTPGEAMEGKGPRQRYRIAGEGDAATVVEDSPAGKRGPARSDRSDSDETAAVKAVKAIYRGSSAYGVMAFKDPAPMRPYLTPALIDAWLHPTPNSIYDFDGDPLTWTQMTDAVSVESATPHDFKGDRGMVRVAVRAVVEDVPRMVTMDWVMLKVGDRWLADDNLAFGHSLRAELAPKPIAAVAPRGRGVRQHVSALMAANGGSDDYVADHNGSLVTVSPSLGTIAYIHARPGMDRMVGIGTVLFRGRFTPGAITGTAYVFRKGCAPAPYAVTSTGYSGTGNAFVLIGHPPIRAPGSCTVVGYGDNANSVLRFEPRDEGDI